MRYILPILLFCFLPFFSKAQTGTPSTVFNGKYYEFKNYVRADSGLFLPRVDTLNPNTQFIAPGKIVWKPQDSLLYYFDGNKWKNLGAGSGVNIFASNGLKMDGDTVEIGDTLTQTATTIVMQPNQGFGINSLPTNDQVYIENRETFGSAGFSRSISSNKTIFTDSSFTKVIQSLGAITGQAGNEKVEESSVNSYSVDGNSAILSTTSNKPGSTFGYRTSSQNYSDQSQAFIQWAASAASNSGSPNSVFTLDTSRFLGLLSLETQGYLQDTVFDINKKTHSSSYAISRDYVIGPIGKQIKSRVQLSSNLDSPYLFSHNYDSIGFSPNSYDAQLTFGIDRERHITIPAYPNNNDDSLLQTGSTGKVKQIHASDINFKDYTYNYYGYKHVVENQTTGEIQKINTTNYLRPPTTLFIQTVSATVNNTTTEGSVISTGKGVNGLLGNTFGSDTIGTNYSFEISGIYSTIGVPGNATVRLKIGSTLIVTTGAINLSGGRTNASWLMKGNFTIRTLGVTGTIMPDPIFFAPNNTGFTGTLAIGLNNAGVPVVVDTHTTAPLDLTIQWNLANVGNTFTCTNFVLRREN